MQSVKVISLSLIFALMVSSFITTYGDTVTKNYKHETTPTFIGKITDPKLTKDFTISLDEKKIQHRNQEVTITLTKQPRVEYANRVHITEDVNVSNDDGSDNQLYLLKHNPTQAILERIFNNRKFNFDKIVGLLSSDNTITTLYHDITRSLGDETGDLQAGDFAEISLDIGNAVNIRSDNDLLQLQPIINTISTESIYDDLYDQITPVVVWLEQQSTTYVFIFATAAFYIIVRSEAPKIKLENYTKTLSFVFIFILISSIVTTPLSISSSYYAHAETEDAETDDDILQDPPSGTVDSNSADFINNNTSIDDFDEIPLSSIINSTLFTSVDIQTNSTFIKSEEQGVVTTPPVNSAISATPSNPTNPIHLIQSLIESLTMTSSTTPPVNSAISATPSNPTNPIHLIQSLIESLTMTSSTTPPVNSAISATPANPTTIPNATKSWSANTTTTDSLVGNAFVNQTGIILNGGFIKAADNTNQTSSITVAAWIRPEYASGASVFTILSKDKSFELTLNNIVNPPQIATFSVFDGIKWHNIQTSTKISQNWSHIAATFNGTDITIYVNGTISNTAKTTPAIIVDAKGDIQGTTPQISLKYADVVVGAALDSRTVDTAQRAFSGSLDEVGIYYEYLTAEQVLALYNKTLPSILIKSVPITPIEIELPQINLLNQTNVNGTLNTNATQYIVIPKINHTNQITISAWVDPEYNNLSDELTVISKDRSFVLSINNVIDPKHTATFTVFDGIRWTEIQGTNKVESLTHLAAVINGTNILLYVNGTLQARKTLTEQFTVSKGELVTNSVTTINSVTDVVIGAYISTFRKDSQLSNKFSGTINDAIIYNRALTETEIKKLFTAQIPETQHIPLFSENVLSFTDNVTLTLIPRVSVDSTGYIFAESAFGITDSVETTINSVIDQIQHAESLGIADHVELFQSTLLANNKTVTSRLGMIDNVTISKSSLISKDPNIVFEERGKDYYKVEFANGTGKATFGLPEWIFDPEINEYKEHIITETDSEIIYDSMQIPFVFNKNDCSLRIYEKGRINSELPVAIGKKYWKLMETQVSSDQWRESTLNNNTCKVEKFENTTGFFINALRENSDGRFLVTYGKKIDQPLESFLYFTNMNENKTNTKFGFVQELENIETDEADLGDQIIVSRPETVQKLITKKFTNISEFLSKVKELKQNEKINKKKSELISEAVFYKKINKESLVVDFSKASKEFSNMKIENTNGRLATTLEFLNIERPLNVGETVFLDPTVTFNNNRFLEVHAAGTGTTCPTPSNIANLSEAQVGISRTNNNFGCKRATTQYDISSISSDNRKIVTNVTTSFTTATFTAAPRTCEVRQMQLKPSSIVNDAPGRQNLWNDIGNGTTYADNITCFATSGGPINLGSGAISDVQSAIDVGRNWFALGWKLTDESRPTSNPAQRYTQFNAISITVTYIFKSSLTEKLGIKDSISFTKSLTKQLSENLGMKDTTIVTKKITKGLSEKLGINDTTVTIKVQKLSEKLGIHDTITVKKTRVSLSERLGFADTTQFTRTAGDQVLSEKLGMSDTLLVGKFNLKQLTEKLGLSATAQTIKVQSVAEKFGLKDTVTAKRFPGIEFNTQNGCTIIPSGQTTKTLTAGTDYVAPQGEAFIRIVDTRLQGLGRTSGGGTQNADRVTAYLSDPDFAGGSITFTRISNAAVNDRICWQIIDYQGHPDNANSIKVRKVGTVTYGATATTVDTSTISGIINDNKVVVFITGQSNVDAGTSRWSTAQSTAEWIGASDIARFTRGVADSKANSLSYAVVEFTGDNWSVQRVAHTFSSTAVEEETITSVGSTERAFFHYQHRSSITSTGLDEAGAEVYFSSPTKIAFDLENTASPASSISGVAWVVSNSQTGSDAMIVQHLSGTRTSTGSEEFTQNISINTVRSTSTTSIMGENARSTGTGTGFPRGTIAFNLTSTNNVVLITSESDPTQNYRFQVVQWPTKPAKKHFVALTENLGIKDAVTTTTVKTRALNEKLGITDVVTPRITRISLTEKLGLADTISLTATKTKSLTENLGLADNIQTFLTRTRSNTESLGLVDTISLTATKTKSLTENLGITDNTAKTSTKSLTENLGITDNTAR
ncbi:MAG: LamG-like jellyroll fold domain-containing protein, partial [Candidatus Nitrosotenuis sp.]